MQLLAAAHFADHMHVVDLPYRLSSWGLDDSANSRLWFLPSGQLAGWAVLHLPFWTLDFTCDPALDDLLLPEMLTWAEGRTLELRCEPINRECWFINIFADQAQRLALLTAAGWVDQSDLGEDSWSKVWLCRSADLPVREYRIPAGFTIRPLGSQAEVAAYVELHQTTFGTKNMTIEWRSRTLLQPAYRPDLDIVVEAPDSSLVAFCIGWLLRTPDGRLHGQVEPLGCHPEYTRYGLGRLALAEVLRRLLQAGVESLHVETDNYRNTALGLYEHMGFALERDVLVLRKDF
jgi:ribosomal protein S18 acetylase RimI-like enzyme